MSWRGNTKKLTSLLPFGGGNSAVEKFLSIDCKSGKIDINEARQIFEQMLSVRPPPPISCFSTLLGALAKSEHLPATISFYKRLDIYGLYGLRSNLIILNILLNCYSNMKSVSVGFSAIGVMLKYGRRLDIFTFNSLIKGLCMEEKLVEAVGLISKMFRLQCPPNVGTFTTVINGLCKSGNVTAALQLHREMVHGKVSDAKGSCMPRTICCTLIGGGFIEWPIIDAKGYDARISPGLFSYNCLIDRLRHSGMDEDAKSLLVEMIDRGVDPDAMTFSMVITLLCKKGKMDEAKEILKMMTLRGKKPSTVIYSTLVDGYCRIGKIEDAMSLYVDMISKGIFALRVTTNIFLKGLFRVHKVGDAISIFENMKKTDASVCSRPDQTTYSIMIDGLCKHGHLDMAEELFLDMQKSGISPDVYAYCSLIDGICKQGNVDKALNLFSDMLATGISPNVVVYTSLFKGLCRGGLMKKAKELFLQMQTSGVSADARYYNSLVDGFYLSNNVKEGNKVLKKMIQDGILPNANTFKIICDNIDKKGSIQQVIWLLEFVIKSDKFPGLAFSLMGSSGYLYDMVIYNLLVVEYCKAGMMEDAHNLLAELEADGCSPDVASTCNKSIRAFKLAHEKESARIAGRTQSITPNKSSGELVP